MSKNPRARAPAAPSEPQVSSFPGGSTDSTRKIDPDESLRFHPDPQPDLRDAALAYAKRVWAGQSPSADHAWRVQRVRDALEAQGLPWEHLTMPEGSPAAAAEPTEWDRFIAQPTPGAEDLV